jgi:hypothetical protein
MRLLIALTILLILTLVGVAGGGGYWYYQQAEQITQSISVNNQIVNESLLGIQSIRFQTISRMLELGKSSKYRDFADDIIPINEEIQAYETAQRTRSESRDLGMNTDTRNLSNAAETVLDGFDEVLVTIKDHITFGSCMATNLNEKLVWNQEIADEWGSTDENFAEVEFVDLVRRTAERFRRNSERLNDFESCFVDDYAIYVDEAYEISLREEKEQYENLADALDILANSVQDFNKINFEAALDEVVASLEVETSFSTDTLEIIEQANQAIDLQTQADIQATFDTYSQAEDEVIRKWFLDPQNPELVQLGTPAVET